MDNIQTVLCAIQWCKRNVNYIYIDFSFHPIVYKDKI